jgi:rhodanese-related sulfurtransferase
VISALGLFGRRAGFVIAGLVALYIAVKYLDRWRFTRELRINRITPEELRELLEIRHPITIIDLRHPGEVERDGTKITGAVVLRPDELRSRAHEIPLDQQIILYCTWPNEATSARVALQLKKVGIRRVRPLAGGLEAWRDLGFPIEPVSEVTAARRDWEVVAAVWSLVRTNGCYYRLTPEMEYTGDLNLSTSLATPVTPERYWPGVITVTEKVALRFGVADANKPRS